ncbi:tetratricopeptide repeat protein [Paludibaculum fermentans]|uniref:tetratricopeptide repeat protein n=1 Tax=Paludibaculum fermentans TaxID=1473598 RepID=UPI003EBB1077
MTGPAEDQKDSIRAELQRILASTAFSGSDRHRRFLSFVVEQALKGDTEKLNEFVLGFEVFNKNESFDPRIDSIVRVEARRLRERLKKYYLEEGQADPLIVTLRPRSFVPEFTQRHAPSAATGATAASWLHSRRIWLVALAALLVGAAGTAVFLSLRPRPFIPPSTASIIVLPFQTFAGATDPELGSALADAIISGLAGNPGLRVISRGSSIQFNESGGSRFERASSLGVDFIVEGSVRVTGPRASVSAKLTDVRTQSYLWADTRETETAKLTDLERELTRAILSRIRVPGPPPGARRAPQRPAGSPQAYGAFLKGQYYWYQGDRDSLARSLALFDEALRGDPNFAPAWAWLSQSYLLMVFHEDGRNPQALARGRQAAAKSLELDPGLAEAHAAVGSYAALDWNWREADHRFRRAVELNPDWAQGHLMFSIMYLVPTRQFPEAVQEAFRAHSLDPLTSITRSMLAEVLYFNRDYARAMAESEDLRKTRSGPPADRAYLLSLSLSGQGQRALAEMSRTDADGNPMGLSLRAYLLARHGDPTQAKAIRDQLTARAKTTYVPPMSLALISTGLGDTNEALRQLHIAVTNHVPVVTQIAADPAFDPLHKDPRFQDLLRQMGLR